LPPSFNKINSPILTLDEKEKFDEWKNGSHAMCVIGYNDKIEGGAFRMLNNWGSNWDDNGII